MKKTLPILSIAFLMSSCGQSNEAPPDKCTDCTPMIEQYNPAAMAARKHSSAVDPAQYSGDWHVRINGGEEGGCRTFVVDDLGKIDAICSLKSIQIIGAQGHIDKFGAIEFTSKTNGMVFVGTITSPLSAAGTWSNPTKQNSGFWDAEISTH